MLFAPDQQPDTHENLIKELPSIVVEILSLDTRGSDLFKKLTKYAGKGIPEYWIVDPDRRSISINVLVDPGIYLPIPIIGSAPIGVGLYRGALLSLDRIFAGKLG